MSPTKTYRLTILKNGVDEDHQFWVQACRKREGEITYRVIDLSKANWLEKILTEETDYFLAKAPGATASTKQMYDERLYIIVKTLAGRGGEMKSGTSRVSWDPPPGKLLDFVKHVTDKGNFLSQAADIYKLFY